MGVSCYRLWNVLRIDSHSVAPIFGLVRLNEPSDEPGVLAEALKHNEKVVEGAVDVLHVVGRKILKENAVVAFLLVLSHQFPLDIESQLLLGKADVDLIDEKAVNAVS